MTVKAPFVVFEMVDKAKLSRSLLLIASREEDSATVNISVFIQQRNISFHNDISQKP